MYLLSSYWECIDPCTINNGDCGEHADCAVVSGAVQCTCHSGYLDDGSGNCVQGMLVHGADIWIIGTIAQINIYK